MVFLSLLFFVGPGLTALSRVCSFLIGDTFVFPSEAKKTKTGRWKTFLPFFAGGKERESGQRQREKKTGGQRSFRRNN